MHKEDNYPMSFLNHIFKKHRIPAILILALFLLFVLVKVFAIGPPGAPSSLTATAGSGQVSLSWTSGLGIAEDDSFIDYKLSSSSTWITFNDGISLATTVTVTGLTNGLSYDFRVTGISDGLSDPLPYDPSDPLGNNYNHSITVTATPTPQAFAPGETIDPNCLPGETNCFVEIPTGVNIDDTVSDGTNGSVLFLSGTNQLKQNNSNLFWDESLLRLGVKNGSPAYTLDVGGIINSSSDVCINGGSCLSTAVGSSLTGLTDSSNTILGIGAITSGVDNSLVGISAAFSNTTGHDNSALGGLTLFANDTGFNNSALGYAALYSNTTGSYNTAVGYGADVASGALFNATAIGGNAIVGTSSSLVLGGTGSYAVNVGIGTTSPSQILDIAKNQNLDTVVAISNPNTGSIAAAGFQAHSDVSFFNSGSASSNYSISEIAGRGGIAELNTSLTIIGNADTIFYQGNGVPLGLTFTESMRIKQNGNVGIGTASPSYKLHVLGDIALTDGTYPSVKVFPSGGWGEMDVQAGVNSSFTAAGDYGGIFVPGGKGISLSTGSFNSFNIAPTTNFVGIGGAGASAGLEIFTSGTGATTALKVNGFDSSSSNYALQINDGSSNPLLYVQNDGNVGIGTASPGYKLDVNGVINAATNFSIGGTAGIGDGTTCFDNGTFYISIKGGLIVDMQPGTCV